jgi:hypothetical protein
MNNLLDKKEEHIKQVSKLTTTDKWSYFKWEWLKRNKAYKNIFRETSSRITRIKESDKIDAKKTKMIEVECFHFFLYCGLRFPVNPKTGTWKECDWLPANADFYSSISFEMVLPRGFEPHVKYLINSLEKSQ